MHILAKQAINPPFRGGQDYQWHNFRMAAVGCRNFHCTMPH
jgi:hypothetical protein